MIIINIRELICSLFKELIVMSKTKSPVNAAKQYRALKRLQVSALSSVMLLAAGHAWAAEECALRQSLLQLHPLS